jgi:hypothetical protein
MLTSVHTFATDPMRGVFILAILVLFIGGALALYGWRAPLLKQGGLFAPISREGALVFNNLFLTTAGATVFIGTLYPLDAFGSLRRLGDVGRHVRFSNRPSGSRAFRLSANWRETRRVILRRRNRLQLRSH